MIGRVLAALVVFESISWSQQAPVHLLVYLIYPAIPCQTSGLLTRFNYYQIVTDSCLPTGGYPATEYGNHTISDLRLRHVRTASDVA